MSKYRSMFLAYVACLCLLNGFSTLVVDIFGVFQYKTICTSSVSILSSSPCCDYQIMTDFLVDPKWHSLNTSMTATLPDTPQNKTADCWWNSRSQKLQWQPFSTSFEFFFNIFKTLFMFLMGSRLMYMSKEAWYRGARNAEYRSVALAETRV